MKNNPCQAESELNMLTSAAGGSQGPLINVTEAAQRLGVSKSTVYRIVRKNGPFRFVADGRRIFIDRTSFEAHLTNTLVCEAEPSLQADDDPIFCPQEVDAERTDIETREAPAAATQPAPASDPAPQVTWCGPREPIIPRRNRPFAIFYSF
jgi:excisionase family DNA binding protein